MSRDHSEVSLAYWQRGFRPLQQGIGGTLALRWQEVTVAAVVCAVVACGLSFVMGRDLNWDYFNYHAYAAGDVFGRRLAQDFFPAGYQGYLNRLAYLPFAAMQAAGWHSIAIACGLAALQSLNVFFLYLIARELTPEAHDARVLCGALTLLGAASGAFLSQLGSTFVDPVTTVPVMAALWLCLHTPRSQTVYVAGGLAGCAVALKLTNAPFAAGVLAAAVAVQPSARRALLAGAGCAVGLLAGFALFYGYWGSRLWSLFGSPFFPAFNQIFKSPLFPAESLAFQRFVPSTLTDALLLPLRMMEHQSWIYVESVAPDVRAAVALLLAAVAGVTIASSRLWKLQRLHWRAVTPAPSAASAASPDPTDGAAASQRDRAVVAFFVLSLFGWLVTSANGRYATPLLLLLGPLIYLTARRLLGARSAAVLCLVVLTLQVVVVVTAGNPRWAPQRWTARWLPASVPRELGQSPYLFVSTATSSESYMAALVHPDSVFVNPIGLISIADGSPASNRFSALRQRWAGRTKLIFPSRDPSGSAEGLRRQVVKLNVAIDRFGLGLDADKCSALAINHDVSNVPFAWPSDQQLLLGAEQQPRQLIVCDAHTVIPSPVLQTKRAQATKILDAYERKCPAIFAPSGAPVESGGRLWTRLYGKYDLFLTVDLSSGQIHYTMEHQGTDVVIGHVDSWQRDAAAFPCRLPHDGARDTSTLGPDAPR